MIAAALVAVVILAAAGVVRSLTPWPVEQPIAFSHQQHIEDVGAECTDCHLYAQSGMRATIPNRAVCADCHSEALSESPEETKLLEYVTAEESIPWSKVYWVPDHVFFSHRRHTTVSEIECETCHGPVAARTEPLTRPMLSITMDRCMECHEETGTSNDCILCHR